MNFLALSPAAAAALLAGVGLIIVLLHLLKPQQRRVTVGSTLLWASVLKRRRRDLRRRWLVSLLLSLGIGLALAAALTQPEAPVLGLAIKRMVLVLDNSPSMAARTGDGGSRWQRAIERARGLIEDAGPGARIMLLDTTGRAPLSGFNPAAVALAELERLPAPAYAVTRMPLLPQEASVELHVISDGVALRELPAGALVHPVFEAADNVALTGLEARPFPTDPTRYEAFVQVYNASPGAKQVRLALRGGERFAITQALEIAASELVDAVFDVSGFPGGILGAAVQTAGDGLPADDLAFATVAPHRPRRVVLVTTGNPQLEDSMRALPGIRLTVLTPPQYRTAPAADAYVFDRFAPAAPPPAGALVFLPPRAPWLPAAAQAGAARVSSWDRTHPLARGVGWGDLKLQSAASIRAIPGKHAVVVMARQGALVVTGKAAAPWIVVGFAPQESSLPLQPAFPVFLGNALAWLSPALPSLARPLGTIRVGLPQAQVYDGNGVRVSSAHTFEGTVFVAARPDVYTLRRSDEQLQVVANLLDPSLAEINRTRFDALALSAARSVQAGGTWTIEAWVVLVLSAAVLLLLDWAAYTRRALG